MPEFQNEPATDFSLKANREAFQEAISHVRSCLGKSYPLILGGERLSTPRSLPRENPSHRGQVVGRIPLSDPPHAQRALDSAASSYPAWRKTPLPRRAEILKKAAQLMRRRRLELAAWEVVEVGKPWIEADADVAEAIDYLNYYPNEMLRWTEETRVGQVPGEQNIYRHEPLGPGAVISPWNFPLAISTGMTTAALVTGNTAILKPAEQSSVIAFHLVEILLEAGVPPGCVHYLPGLGGEVGEYLVRSRQVHFIAFTGSQEVGLKIIQQASDVPPGQLHVKRVIAEMGGKNAIVIDEDADLDEVVTGVAASSFGYQGQKCSACSRVIVLESIAEAFSRRLIQTTQSLPLGPAEEPGTTIGPLVDEEALKKVRDYITLGKTEGTIAFQGVVPQGLDGYFIEPVIFTDLTPQARIAQEEIFGPVLVILKARTFEEALWIANASPYALTGGVYSRSPRHIQQAKEEFLVGNLYINRKITGAAVGRQPFGGLRLSGIGHKAGGPDYLLQFLQARAITENTLRHGFAPLEG